MDTTWGNVRSVERDPRRDLVNLLPASTSFSGTNAVLVDRKMLQLYQLNLSELKKLFLTAAADVFWP